MKTKLKRAAALGAVLLILAAVAAALVCAFIGTENALRWLGAILFSLVIIPVVVYGWILAVRVFKKREDEDDLS